LNEAANLGRSADHQKVRVGGKKPSGVISNDRGGFFFFFLLFFLEDVARELCGKKQKKNGWKKGKVAWVLGGGGKFAIGGTRQ
jgi:hypothetical protein